MIKNVEKFRIITFYKSIVFALILLCSVSYSQQAKDTRLTYLWDVTLSMKGFNGAPNIYDKVVDALVKDIKQQSNERTEIVVIPFQNSEYSEIWRNYATESGKKKLISLIKNYKNDNVTNTNISAPILYAIKDVFSKDKIDILKLMTDGKDNVNPDKLKETLSSWCEVAKGKNVNGFYIMLTDNARDSLIFDMIKNSCRFKTIFGTEIDAIISLTPQKNASINIRDDYNKKLNIKLTPNDGAQQIAQGFKVHVSVEDNPYIDIDEDLELKNDFTIDVTPKFKASQEDLMNILPMDENQVLSLKIVPAKNMDVSPYALTSVLDIPTKLSLINKPEKTLKFYVK